MGYPVVEFKINGAKVDLMQKRFLYEQPAEDEDIVESPYKYVMNILIDSIAVCIWPNHNNSDTLLG